MPMTFSSVWALATTTPWSVEAATSRPSTPVTAETMARNRGAASITARGTGQLPMHSSRSAPASGLSSLAKASRSTMRAMRWPAFDRSAPISSNILLWVCQPTTTMLNDINGPSFEN